MGQTVYKSQAGQTVYKLAERFANRMNGL